MLIQAKAVKIKAQLMMLVVEVLPATEVKQLHSFCSSLRGYDEWAEVRYQRRVALSQVAMLYFAMAKLREGTDLGWSRLSGFQYDVEGATRETDIMAHAEHLLPTNLRHQLLMSTQSSHLCRGTRYDSVC